MKIIGILSGKGGVGKSLAYSEYVSLSNGNIIQIGPYIDKLINDNPARIKKIITLTNSGEEIFEALEPPEDLLLNIVKIKPNLKSEVNKPEWLMRKPAPTKLIEITTPNGKIKVTKEHKFLVFRENGLIQVKAEDLNEKKDFLLQYNFENNPHNLFEKGNKSIASLLGYIIGDGHIDKKQQIHVFTEEKNLRNITNTFIKIFNEYNISQDKRTKVYRISYCKKKGLEILFREYKLQKATAEFKEIPEKIFKCNNIIVSEFLSSLFDCDGHICKNRNEIQYVTKSEKLANQISNILRCRFNIENQLKEIYKRATNGKKEKQKYYQINISGEDIISFKNLINFKNTEKKKRLELKKTNNFNTNIKLFPFEKKLKIIREDNNILAKEIAKSFNCSKQMIYEYEWGYYTLSKKTTNKFIDYFKKRGVNNKHLEEINELISDGFTFKRVESKKEISYSEKYVYDFQICDEGGHFTHSTGIIISNTTTSINLAIALSCLGKETILIDNNLTTPNVGLHLGITNTNTTIHHVLQGKKKIHQAIHHHPMGLKFIPGSLSLNDMQGLKLNNLKSIHELKADFIIIDGAAGLGKEAISTIEHAEELLIITNPELPAITDALKAIKIAEELNKQIKGIIVTRKRNDNFEVSNKNIESLLEYPIISIIPEDYSIKESQVMKDSVVLTHPNSKAAQAYIKLASSLSNIPYYQKKETLIKKILNFFKKA